MAVAGTARSFTINLPVEQAERVEELAAREHRTVSEVVDSALQAYRGLQVRSWLQDVGEFAAGLNSEHREEDVPRLIREVRAEEAAERVSRG